MAMDLEKGKPSILKTTGKPTITKEKPQIDSYLG